ncbi:alpha/beta hydrolase [Planococcus dechangensis]|uniref:Alpha/beta hydrolase n=1 Tax=Planococcus dechangensis TaxID=1176255 RepID=A0ABV9MCB4_9BACL
MKIRTLAVMLAMLLLAAGCGNRDDEPTEEEKSAIDGTWEGTIEVPEQAIPIVLTFADDSGSLSIPSQGVTNYPLSTVKIEDPSVAFDVDLQGQRLLFEGQLGTETIAGTFTQQGKSFPFELKPAAQTPPEEPENAVETEVEGGMMNAVVDLPEGDGPHPVAILIAGSGPTDKDGNSVGFPGKNNSLKMIGEQLAEQGIAVIRYDKRGIGDNMEIGIEEEDLRFEDFTKDAGAWIRFAKQDERFADVSVIGHSEGALIGLIASNEEGVDSYVSLTGVGRPSGELLREQLASLPAEQLEEAEQILEQLEAGRTVDSVSSELQPVFRPSVQPYLQSWMAHDPLVEVAKLDAPALFVGGTRDLQVPASDAELLYKAKTPDGELLVIDGMNHVLKPVADSEEENRKAYGDPDLPLADGLIDGITAFLNDH